MPTTTYDISTGVNQAMRKKRRARHLGVERSASSSAIETSNSGEVQAQISVLRTARQKMSSREQLGVVGEADKLVASLGSTLWNVLQNVRNTGYAVKAT